MSRPCFWIAIALCLGLTSCWAFEGKKGGEHCADNDECESACCIDTVDGEPYSPNFCAHIRPKPNHSCKSGSSAQGCGEYRDDGLVGQTKSFCQTAYAYKCQGNQQGVDSTCNTLGGFGGDFRSRCPYCN